MGVRQRQDGEGRRRSERVKPRCSSLRGRRRRRRVRRRRLPRRDGQAVVTRVCALRGAEEEEDHEVCANSADRDRINAVLGRRRYGSVAPSSLRFKMRRRPGAARVLGP